MKKSEDIRVILDNDNNLWFLSHDHCNTFYKRTDYTIRPACQFFNGSIERFSWSTLYNESEIIKFTFPKFPW